MKKECKEGLTFDDVERGDYTRMKVIQRLLDSGQLNSSLRRTAASSVEMVTVPGGRS